jgi:hypothetical protein
VSTNEVFDGRAETAFTASGMRSIRSMLLAVGRWRLNGILGAFFGDFILCAPPGSTQQADAISPIASFSLPTNGGAAGGDG